MTAEEYNTRREKVLNRVPTPPRYTTEEYERYKLICEGRIVDSLDKFPSEIRELVGAALEYVHQTYGVTEIKLRGSFSRGEWITEQTDEGFKYLREKIRHKIKISDVDLVVEGITDMFELEGIKFDIIPHDPRGIKVWEKII